MLELFVVFFILNDLAVDCLLGQVSQILCKVGKFDVLNGYGLQSWEWVWLMVLVIYFVVVKMQIGYVLLFSSFECNG